MPPETGDGTADVAGILLAGGLARRMGGGDKPLRELGGKPILDHVVERVRPQVGQLAINANGDPQRFARYELPVVPDVIEGHAGPLAGILTGLAWARAQAGPGRWLASFATDSPFLPTDLVAQLRAAAESDGAALACANSQGRDHPVFGLWSLDLYDDLYRAVVDEGTRKIDAFTGRYPLARVTYAADPIDPFFNANRPEDLDWAESWLARGGSALGS